MSDRLGYELGVYVQRLREREAAIQKMLIENNPWPDNMHPSAAYYDGKRTTMREIAEDLDAIVGGL